MPKFMIKASYNADGARGLLKEGGTARRAQVEKIVAGMGGKVEAFYYAFGDTDVISMLPSCSSERSIRFWACNSAAREAASSMRLPQNSAAARVFFRLHRTPGA